MMYTLVVRPSVTAEAARVYAYREAERPGSGEHFLEALGNCYARIKASPFGFQVRRGEYRHAMLHRLKYRVVFRVKGDHIFVVQVRHTSRKGSKRFGP
jgi:hypothetical protein